MCIRDRGYAGSDDEGYTADRFVLRSDDSADTLCVRAIVSTAIANNKMIWIYKFGRFSIITYILIMIAILTNNFII